MREISPSPSAMTVVVVKLSRGRGRSPSLKLSEVGRYATKDSLTTTTVIAEGEGEISLIEGFSGWQVYN
jgi:hypothetical protein